MVVRFQVDPDFYDHPKSIGMTDAATALWVRAGSYSAAKLLDGFIAEHVLSTLSRTPEDASAELVARGLWRRVKGGYRFHQWDERNLTRERIEADRAADRERKRAERATDRVTHTDTCHGCGNTYVTARSDSKYCSANCRKRAHRDAKAQAATQDVQPESTPDSDRNPDGIRPVSVSVSVSESESGSGRAPAASNGARPPPPEEPPRTCPEHANDPDPPKCGPCADARRAWTSWDANRPRGPVPLANDVPRCRRHHDQPAHNCGTCRSERIGAEP